MDSETTTLLQAMELKRKGFCREAIVLYESMSYEDPQVYGPVGMIYHKGDGDVKKDLDRAINCYQRAISEEVTPAISRALIEAYYEKGFEGVNDCDRYLEKIADLEAPVSQLACLWLFALRFRDQNSPEVQANGRRFGEKAARMGNVFARKAIAETKIKEGRIFTGILGILTARLSELNLGLINKEDIRLQKH